MAFLMFKAFINWTSIFYVKKGAKKHMQVRKSWTRTFALILMIALMVGMLPVTQAQAATTHGTFSMQDLPYSYQFTSSYPAPFGNITHERTWHAYYVDENGSGNIRQTIVFSMVRRLVPAAA